jgi:hypothetical protein
MCHLETGSLYRFITGVGKSFKRYTRKVNVRRLITHPAVTGRHPYISLAFSYEKVDLE